MKLNKVPTPTYEPMARCDCGAHYRGRCDSDFPAYGVDMRDEATKTRVNAQMMRARALIKGDKRGRRLWEAKLLSIGYTAFDRVSVADSDFSVSVCEECGKPFEAQRTTAKYCSDRCRGRAHKTSDSQAQ